jgi:hypothetical protein
LGGSIGGNAEESVGGGYEEGIDEHDREQRREKSSGKHLLNITPRNDAEERV